MQRQHMTTDFHPYSLRTIDIYDQIMRSVLQLIKVAKYYDASLDELQTRHSSTVTVFGRLSLMRG